MNDKPKTGTILFEVALLTIVVFLVDEWLIRGALAFIPAMLLAQRALDSAGRRASSGLTDGQGSELIGEPIKKLQAIFREFSAMCHLMGSDGITSEQALERSNDLENDLNSLMEEVTGIASAAAAPEMAAPVPEMAVATPDGADGLPTI